MLRFVAVIACGVVIAGCASVTRGTDEQVVFDTVPPGAEMRSVVVDVCSEPGACPTVDRDGSYINRDLPPEAGPACVTPCTLAIKRNVELMVTFTKAGYEPQSAKLGRALAAAGGVGFAGNVILGGGIGMVTDGITGATTDHYPNPLRVTLVPIRQPAPAERPAKRR